MEPRFPRLQIRALLFDLDNTLYDHSRASREALVEAAREFTETAALDPEDLCRQFSRHNDDCWALAVRGEMARDDIRVARFRRTLAGFGLETLEPARLSEAYLGRYRRLGMEVPGARETVLTLLERVPVGVVTNGFPELVHEKLAAIGLAERLAPVVVAERLEVMKPRPDGFFAALRELRLSAEEVLYVGDSLAVDVAGAAAAGLRTCWFNRLGEELPRDAVRPDVVVSRLEELRDVFDPPVADPPV